VANGPDEDALQGGSGRDWRPTPDPTSLTTQQLRETEVTLNRSMREQIASLRELLETRLSAMDKATELLAATVGRVPSETDKAIISLRDLINRRLDGMDTAAGLQQAASQRSIADSREDHGRIRVELAAAIAGLRELLVARIDGMDQATKLLADNFAKLPSDIDRAVGSLKEILDGDIDRVKEVLTGETRQVSAVTEEKFAAVDALFASNATALTAALAAQEKAVAEQNKSNTLAIDKSEQATKETIAANAAQTTTGLSGLSTALDDLKQRIVRLEGQVQSSRTASEDTLAVGTFRQTTEQNRAVQSRTNIQLAIAAFSGLIAIIAIIFAVVQK
jgi:hypothetical protein